MAGVATNLCLLRDRIQAFEIHPREARRARIKVAATLRELGLHHATAIALAKAWIRNADFLLSPPPSLRYTHVVGNPPYVRWAKIPEMLRIAYSKNLPPEMTGGDLFLPFLDRSLEQLRLHGRCGFLCSDRWRFMAFAEHFRTKWLPHLEISSEDSMLATNAYNRDVDAYPSILIARRIGKEEMSLAAPAIRSRKTLRDFGFRVKVGPALGHTSAFVLEPGERDVERDLLRPWIDTSEIYDGTIVWLGRRVIAMHGNDGSLVEPKRFPLTLRRLERFRPILRKRSIVLKGAPWFRPIDRVCPSDWERPKLLIPEIAKIPRVALDLSGAIPSHGVYAVFAPNEKLGTLYDQLRGGGLAKALEGIAPRIKGGYTRCYKRFLEQITLD
jgi:hypothetical protein